MPAESFGIMHGCHKYLTVKSQRFFHANKDPCPYTYLQLLDDLLAIQRHSCTTAAARLLQHEAPAIGLQLAEDTWVQSVKCR